MDGTTVTEIRNVLNLRVEEAMRAGKDKLADRWVKELEALSQDSFAQVLGELEIKPEVFSNLAIYATQKVRRLLGAFLGAGRVDPYTQAIMRNAKSAGGTLSDKAIRATLNDKRSFEEKLATRRAAADTTGATQASSTRQALIALGVAEMVRDGKTRAMKVNFDHPLARKVFA